MNTKLVANSAMLYTVHLDFSNDILSDLRGHPVGRPLYFNSTGIHKSGINNQG